MLHNLYKQNFDKKERQEIRRQRLLQHQRLKRLEQQDEKRHLKELDQHNDRKRKSYYKSHKIADIQNIQLQLSEWLKEKPENFDDWMLVPCPKGQRCIVMTVKGETKMFSKSKRYCMTFSSLLPGGGGINTSSNDCCVLDCIYNKEIDVFYILDALSFAIPLMDCDAEFRFFWLKSKINELFDLEDNCKCGNLKDFKLLDYYDMSNDERVSMALQTYPLWSNNRPHLDGFLFYHKRSHYVCGTTPLVCWLFPFMLPDVLQMSVSDFYLPPFNYCKQNPWLYMDEFDEEMARKQLRRKTKWEKLKQNESSTGVNSVFMEDQNSMENHNENTQKCADKDYVLEALLTAEKLLELE